MKADFPGFIAVLLLSLLAVAGCVTGPANGPPAGPGGPAACIPDWVCSGWSECGRNSTRQRSCGDANSCGTDAGRPAETERCELGGIFIDYGDENNRTYAENVFEDWVSVSDMLENSPITLNDVEIGNASGWSFFLEKSVFDSLKLGAAGGTGDGTGDQQDQQTQQESTHHSVRRALST